MNPSKVAFIASEGGAADEARTRFMRLYPSVAPEEAEVIVALGGDGFMLRALHRFMERRVPIFGMNRGSVGFLMNSHREDNLFERLAKAQRVALAPLRMTARRADGAIEEALAINEVSLFRQTYQAAHIRVLVDGVVRLEEMVCDGVLVATPAGSTAYNSSVQGPILPLGSGVLALTPISAFRPRRWRGALLPRQATVRFDILQADKRPLSATADYTEARDVVEVTVREDRSVAPVLLFDPEHNLEERIIGEQFLP